MSARVPRLHLPHPPLSPKDEERVRIGKAERCPHCDRIIAIQIPKGGDGTLRVFVWHGAMAQGNWGCEGSRKPAPNWGW